MKIAVAGGTGTVGAHVVDLLDAGGHDVVSMARSTGVDVISGEGLSQALAGVEVIVDCVSTPSSDEATATEFFTTVARNLHREGERAGVRGMVETSFIACDRFTAGYGATKFAHERAMLAGPIPVQILRAAQFHELVPLIIEWGTQGDESFVPKMRTQLVAARTAAELLAELALAGEATWAASSSRRPIPEIAGPREENLAAMAALFADRRDIPVRVEEVSDADDPDRDLIESDAVLPGPEATLAGPTFEEWLDSSTA
jgi:uncharacterized protein YbjT (DUF2867 family)